jgi:hypothetical protein
LEIERNIERLQRIRPKLPVPQIIKIGVEGKGKGKQRILNMDDEDEIRSLPAVFSPLVLSRETTMAAPGRLTGNTSRDSRSLDQNGQVSLAEESSKSRDEESRTAVEQTTAMKGEQQDELIISAVEPVSKDQTIAKLPQPPATPPTSPLRMAPLPPPELVRQHSNNPYRNGTYLLHRQGAGSKYITELKESSTRFEVG